MGRSLIDTGKSRFNNRKVFTDSFGESFTVPAGVTEVYATLVAAGGRDLSAYIVPLGVNAAMSLCTSPNGAYTVGTVVSGSTSDLLFYDPIGKKVARRSPNNLVQINNGGRQTVVLDNGFIAYAGETSPLYWSTNAGFGNASSYGIAVGMAYSTFAAAPVDSALSPMSDVRAWGINSTTTTLNYWSGSTFTNGAAYAGKAFASMSYANGYFIAGENNATSKTSLYYQTKALSAGSTTWSNVVIDAVNDNAIYDVTYGGGLYVAVGAGGNIYTCATINGTWVGRTSGVATQLNAVKYANGRFVVVGSSGVTCTSTDGITWSTTTASTSARFRGDLQWWAANSVWVLAGGSSLNFYYSADATSWTGVTALNCRALTITAAGMIYCTGSATASLTTSHLTATDSTAFSTSNVGGSAGVSRVSGSIVKVTGGAVGMAQVGGDGGSSFTANVMRGGTSATSNPAQGMGGNGGITTVIQASGTGGFTNAANLYGGGGAPLLETINEELEGVFIPGGGGAYWATSGQSGGGGTILAPGGTAATDGMGYGGGMGSTSTGAGGGGESVVRYKIATTPGETLCISCGLASTNGIANYNPRSGFAMLEWSN